MPFADVFSILRSRDHPAPLPYMSMASREGCTVDDAALLLGPGLAVRVGSARVFRHQDIRAGWRQLPAISKLQHVTDHRLAACGEVIDGIVIKVPTQATDLAL